jgi:hypothetical protein
MVSNKLGVFCQRSSLVKLTVTGEAVSTRLDQIKITFLFAISDDTGCLVLGQSIIAVCIRAFVYVGSHGQIAFDSFAWPVTAAGKTLIGLQLVLLFLIDEFRCHTIKRDREEMVNLSIQLVWRLRRLQGAH